jgi:hypothetical protein
MGFTLFKFLHVLTMFAAVASAVIPEVVLHRIAAGNNVPATRAVAGFAAGLGKLLPVLFVGGALFGLLAAASGEINFLAPWLIAAYIVFIIAMVIGATILGPWAAKMAVAAESSPDAAPSTALTALIHDRRAMIGSTVLMSSIVVIIFLMVVKPGA